MISIIIASYKKERFIEQTLESILHQEMQDWQLIIVDDHSTDGTPAILKEWEQRDPRIEVLFNTENRGANRCRNQGLQMAKAEYVIFLDADDLLAPYCLKQRLQIVERFPKFNAWVFSMGVFHHHLGDASKALFWIPTKLDESNYLLRFFHHRLPWSIVQPIWQRAFLLENGGFDEGFVRLQDVELHTRLLLKGAKICAFPELPADCFYRIDEHRIIDSSSAFMNRFVRGAIQYYSKFIAMVNNRSHRRGLSLTLVETMSNVLIRVRNRQITSDQGKILLQQLIETCTIPVHRLLLKSYAMLDRISPVHPKGLKKIISALLMRCG